MRLREAGWQVGAVDLARPVAHVVQRLSRQLSRLRLQSRSPPGRSRHAPQLAGVTAGPCMACSRSSRGWATLPPCPVPPVSGNSSTRPLAGALPRQPLTIPPYIPLSLLSPYLPTYYLPCCRSREPRPCRTKALERHFATTLRAPQLPPQLPPGRGSRSDWSVAHLAHLVELAGRAGLSGHGRPYGRVAGARGASVLLW